ncbi:MAG: condensation domain-containing protein, partial [Bacteroidota bacterium]
KGVVIEHQAILNVLQFLQRRYPLQADDVYLFKTNHSFDVSVAEIFGWFFEGGSLVILPPGEEVEPVKMLACITDYQVTHMNFVPSMFTVFMDELERRAPEEVAHLKYILLAGEALPAELIKRYQATGVSADLENIYGPTEGTIYSSWFPVTDFEGQKVPIGKPVDNVRLYVVNSFDQLVPVGVAGELCIAGAGVAREYLNNPILTREKFVTDPFQQGAHKMYRTGDLVCWRADGNIEYLGRLDDQVKIRGFRIELGEIAYHLSAHDQIRDCMVLDREHAGSKFLVAYYIASETLTNQEMREHLSKSLPDYMIPSIYQQIEELPMTANGKLDKQSLPAVELQPTVGYELAQTKEEKILTSVWSQVLGVDQPGINDHFFSLGGDSIKSVQVSSRLRTHGYELPIRAIMANPTIAELSRKLQPVVRKSDQSPVTGTLPLTPIQRWFLEGPITQKEHFNQSVMMRFNEILASDDLREILSRLQDHHDALRTVFEIHGDQIIQRVLETGNAVALEQIDLSENQTPQDYILAKNQELQQSMTLDEGPLMKAILYQQPKGSMLFVVIHHLVVDGISWRILFEDLESLRSQQQNGELLALPPKTDSFKHWSISLKAYQESSMYEQAAAYWAAVTQQEFDEIPHDFEDGINRYETVIDEVVGLSDTATRELLTAAHIPFNTEINDLLLVALMISMKQAFDIDTVRVDMEGHGREQLESDVNISRTIGWFTSIYPVVLGYQQEDLSQSIKRIKEGNKAIPNNGLDYLMYQYQNTEKSADGKEAQLSFNYLGQFDADLSEKSFELVNEGRGDDISQDAPRIYDLELSGIIIDGKLQMRMSYSTEQFDSDTIRQLMSLYEANLNQVIRYCVDYDSVELTPADLTYDGMSLTDLDQLNRQYDLEDIYLLSPLQEGMMFHSLMEQES